MHDAMADSFVPLIPTRPATQWPVGARLRFRADAQLNPQYDQLRGRPVLVLSKIELIGPSESGFTWRQQILSLGNCRVGWARPDQLELLPLDQDEGGF